MSDGTSYAVTSRAWAGIAAELDVDVDEVVGMEAKLDENGQVICVIIEREDEDGESVFDEYLLD